MNKMIRAIYQNGVFHPLERVDLKDQSEVLVTIELNEPSGKSEAVSEDPLAGISFSSGLGDLSAKFDEYRFGNRE